MCKSFIVCLMSLLIPTACCSMLSGITASFKLSLMRFTCLFSLTSFSNGNLMMVGVLKPTPSSSSRRFFCDFKASFRKSPNLFSA